MFRRFLVFALVGIVALLTAAYLFVPPITLEITQQQIDGALQNKLPHIVKKPPVSVVVNDATVQLSDDGKIQINAQFDASGLTLEGTGTAAIISTIRYNRGRFYLTDLKKEDISFEVSENSADTISEFKSALENLLERETEEAVARDETEGVERVNKINKYYENELHGALLSALDEFLSTFPVYRLDQAGRPMKLAALAIEDVAVNKDKISVRLSAQTLLKQLMIAVFLNLALLATMFLPVLLTNILGTSIERKNREE